MPPANSDSPAVESPEATMDHSRRAVQSKVFNDSVHGHIRLPALCVAVVDTPQFQRLRSIKQVGTVYLVYPGASHNRFEHSLGVCYLAGELLHALEANSAGKSLISPEEHLCVQLAGLCHDLGHGPFSHTWERFLAEFGIHWQHEKSSMAMFDHIVEANGLEEEFLRHGLDSRHRTLIKEIIFGEGTSLPSNKHFLYEIVANRETGVDVDKWDYILRDSQHLNIQTPFNYERLLSKIRVLEGADGRTHVAYRLKLASTLYDLFRVRADLHCKAYQHKVVKNTEQMIVDALVAANEGYKIKLADGRCLKLSEAHLVPEALATLTDHIQLNIQFSSNPSLAAARHIFYRINTRRFYTYIDSYNIGQMDCDGVEGARRALASQLGAVFAPLQFSVVATLLNMGPQRDPLNHILFYSKLDRTTDGALPTTVKGITWDRVPGIFPQEPQFLCRKDLLVFCKSESLDGDVRQRIEEMVARVLPAIVKLHIGQPRINGTT